jgi:hypothetical protein
VALEDLTVSRREPAPPPAAQHRLPVLDALRRHFLLVLLPIVLLVGAAVAYGLQREPEYTSEARLNVGGLNLTQQSVEGYTVAVQQLAVAYSRAIHATSVVEAASQATGVPPAQVIERVGASPIPGSSVIRIFATGSDAGQTRRLADAASAALVDYAITLNSGRIASRRILDRFREASTRLAVERAKLRRARRERTRRTQQTRVDVARLNRDTAAFLYGQSQNGQAFTELVQQLAPAEPAKSDRDDVTKEYAAGAAIAGLLIGIGLAVMRANAVARRRLGAA